MDHLSILSYIWLSVRTREEIYPRVRSEAFWFASIRTTKDCWMYRCVRRRRRFLGSVVDIFGDAIDNEKRSCQLECEPWLDRRQRVKEDSCGYPVSFCARFRPDL